MSGRSILLILLAIAMVTFASPVRSAAIDAEVLASPQRVVEYSSELVERGDYRSALNVLEAGRDKFRKNRTILRDYADLLYDRERFGAARRAYLELSADAADDHARSRIEEIDRRFERLTSSLNLAAIAIQKATDAGNFDTAIALGDLAIAKFPGNAVLLTAKGEAQYRKGDLDAAEVTFRRALQIDPFDRQARSYVEEIRTTEEAQTSTEFAEWMSIAKDKVGDFIVTFLALFAAFLSNSLMSPLILRYKLGRARRLFEQGQYDEFTDLIEGLLDKEDFSPLRANFRFLLREKSLEEARDILDKYVNTPDRLPALLRILEREHEKMAQTASA